MTAQGEEAREAAAQLHAMHVREHFEVVGCRFLSLLLPQPALELSLGLEHRECVN